jgi:ferrous iron transport protein A
MAAAHNFHESGCLLDMPCGCKLKVDALTGNDAIRSKLYSLGILPGAELEVSRPAAGGGNVCVRVRQCSLVLGKDVACGIRCCPAQAAGQAAHAEPCAHAADERPAV